VAGLSPWLVIGVALAGGAGAICRHALHGAVSASAAGSFPAGTLAVNLTGAFLLGLLVGIGAGDDARSLLGTGLLGAYTTFSTWMLETERLEEDDERAQGVANLIVPLVLGVLLVLAGRELGAAL
jgi:CrcB protein